MAREHIPTGMTATQVNVLVGVRDGRVYRRKMEGTERDLMDVDGSLPQGVGRQVTWLLDPARKYIRKGKERSGRAYYELTVVGLIIAQGL